MFQFSVILFLTFPASHRSDSGLPRSCPDLSFGSIPDDHLFHKKEKPLIIAHRGQPKFYQENTYDGILSSVDIKADGFELDIYKTKDDKLIVFHDDDTERMTGVSKIIWESTYEELKQLNLTTNFTAGGKSYIYDKSRKIPLLEEILNATKKTDLLHYLEMKPSRPSVPGNVLADSTGRMVADMITKFDLVKKTIVVSFDYHKIHAVKSRNKDITIGTLYTTTYSQYPKTTMAATWFSNLTQCANDASNDTLQFFQFTVKYGLPFKYSGSSSFDCGIDLYNDPRYSNNTIASLRKYYGDNVSTGFYTIYKLEKDESENEKDEIKLKQLIGEGGGDRLITDDVPRLRKFIGKDKDKKASTGVKMELPSSIIITSLIFSLFVNR